MVKISFTNAQVMDRGFGLTVNGESLEDLISMALGTKAKGVSYGDPDYDKLKTFEANSCDVCVLIVPHPTEVTIETEEEVYNSIEEMEEDISERIKQETPEAES